MFFIFLCVCEGDYLMESSRNYALWLLVFAWAHHCMRFAAPGLSVGENGSVIALQNIIDKRKGSLFIYYTL